MKVTLIVATFVLLLVMGFSTPYFSCNKQTTRLSLVDTCNGPYMNICGTGYDKWFIVDSNFWYDAIVYHSPISGDGIAAQRIKYMDTGNYQSYSCGYAIAVISRCQCPEFFANTAYDYDSADGECLPNNLFVSTIADGIRLGENCSDPTW
jgi:hypothetical protein